jgi:hypothetical protein
MSDRKLTAIAKELIEAKKRIENPENWCAGRFGFGSGRLCALGAIFAGRPVGETLHATIRALDDAADESFRKGGAISVNDDLGHAAVMQLYDHAIARALAEGK